MKVSSRIGAIGATLGILVGGLTAQPAHADSYNQPTTATKCRVQITNAAIQAVDDEGQPIEGEDAAQGVFNPGVTPITGSGAVVLTIADGTRLTLKPDGELRCRRDGGRVPQHGGANIADAGGRVVVQGSKSSPARSFDVHVEDRGTGFESEDYLAVRIMDGPFIGNNATGNELHFNANFLLRGDIRLIPA